MAGIKGWKSFLSRISIRSEIFCLLAGSVCMVGVIGLSAFQVSFERYDQTIYSLAFESLNLYTANVENELSNIEKHTFSVVVNATLQQYLKQANRPDETSRLSVYLSLVSLLGSIGFKENYTETVAVVDNLGTQYMQGRNRDFRQEDLEEILQQAAGAQGNNVILVLPDEEPSIIFARQIRKMEHIDLDPYGTLILRINPEALIRYTAQYAGRYSGNMAIFQGNHRIYEEKQSASGRFISEVMQRQQSGEANGFFIQRVPQEGRKFVVYSRSEQTGWTYLNVLSYDEIFQDLYTIRQMSILMVLLVLTAVSLIGLWLSNTISQPLIQLIQTMSRVEQGDFQAAAAKDFRVQGSCLEVRQLCEDYVIMLSKIEALINEDYKKQLLLKEAQLKWLEAQINPHFLYNTLESINWMARMDGNDQIASMAKSLGHMMRSVVSRDSAGSIAVSKELKLLEDYLKIQQIRYENRLSVQFKIDKGALGASIPKLLLQPLVENAVNYALEGMVGCCRIVVSVRQQEETLVLAVEDNGPGMESERVQEVLAGKARSSRTGLGLRNIRERLEIMYGNSAHFELDSAPGQGTRIFISIPYEEDEGDV